MKKIDIIEVIINEINRDNNKKLEEEKLFMKMNRSLCNDVLYNDNKYKESTIIMTNIFKNIMTDFIKEVNNYINKAGVYKNE